MEWDELTELYGQVIIERAQDTQWFHPLEGSVKQTVVNPTCGDAFTVAVARRDNRITGAAITAGDGCMIARAAAAVVCELVDCQPVEAAQARLRAFTALVTHKRALTAEEQDQLGDGMAFTGVARFPVRVKCALLACEGVQQIIDSNSSR
ncbi:Fe-S cluster assembly sulfur transfer protein SufU [Ligilactobacillus sp. LYQ60]|uniref:Fe-S cluster assembly sulfur transfer protein SufU n=1 Tax=unclassified Ligilactobacillus TaxID=2767920 RepID=UPI0038538E59